MAVIYDFNKKKKAIAIEAEEATKEELEALKEWLASVREIVDYYKNT